MLREKGIAVPDYSSSFMTTRLRQASSIMAEAAAAVSQRSTLTTLDEATEAAKRLL